MTSTTFVDKETIIQASWLNDVNAATYGGDGVFTPAGTGAVPTTVQAKLRESVSVLDFMTATEVAGCVDGTVNVSSAFQNAINANEVVYVPPGKYQINVTLTVPVTHLNQTIFGDSKSTSTLLFTSATDGIDFSAVPYARPKILKLGLRACHVGCGKALKFNNPTQPAGNHAEFDIDISAGGYNNTDTTGQWAFGIWSSALQSSSIRLVSYQACEEVVHFEGYNAAIDFYEPNIVGRASFTRNAIYNDSSIGVYVDKGCIINIFGGVIQGAFGASSVHNKWGAMRFYGTYFENTNNTPSDGSDIYLEEYGYNNIFHSCFWSVVFAGVTFKTVGSPLGQGSLLIDNCYFNSIDVSATDAKVSIQNSRYNTGVWTAPNIPFTENNRTGGGSGAIDAMRVRSALEVNALVTAAYYQNSTGFYYTNVNANIQLLTINVWVPLTGAGDSNALLFLTQVGDNTSTLAMAKVGSVGTIVSGGITGLEVSNAGGAIAVRKTSGLFPQTIKFTVIS